MSAVVPIRKSIRRLRFFLLENLVLPLAIFPLRALIWSWRKEGPGQDVTDEIAAMPRVILTIWHGSLLHGFAFFPLAKPYGRRWRVLVTPSLDGRLAAATLDRLDAGHVLLVSGVRGVDAATQFIRCVEAGEVGVIIADGPLGPRGVVKAGVARTVAVAGAPNSSVTR